MVCVPFVIGIAGSARALGIVLGAMALPDAGGGRVDLAEAPRRALVVTLQLTAVAGTAEAIEAARSLLVVGTVDPVESEEDRDPNSGAH